MKKVAKLIMVDKDDQYLMLIRSNHPVFGSDPDLPGGTGEGEESALETLIREVEEEIGVTISDAEEVYAGLGYSSHGTFKSLFITQVEERPEIRLSWEHSGFEWISRDAFIEKAKNAKDDYMRMAYDVLSSQNEA